MPMSDDSENTQSADLTLTRHRALVAVLEGERPMDWTAWALPIHNAESLTPRGREVALWAADVLPRLYATSHASASLPALDSTSRT